MKTLKTIAMIPLVALALTFAAGCGDDSNPVAPTTKEEPPAVIKTPIKMRITQIALWDYPADKTNGDSWDTKNPFNPSSVRPDVYLVLGNYHTKTLTDAVPAQNTFLKWDGRSYVQMNYADDFNLNLYDEDDILGGADDFMDVCKMSPKDFYRNDNASGVSFFLWGKAGTRLWVTATWVYPAK